MRWWPVDSPVRLWLLLVVSWMGCCSIILNPVDASLASIVDCMLGCWLWFSCMMAMVSSFGSGLGGGVGSLVCSSAAGVDSVCSCCSCSCSCCSCSWFCCC